MNNYWIVYKTYLGSLTGLGKIEQSDHPRGPEGEWWDGLNPDYSEGVVCPIIAFGPYAQKKAKSLLKHWDEQYRKPMLLTCCRVVTEKE